MNILPHKSWHVRTKKNIARVRRDEERAKKEEEENQRRINLAEHEARIDHLKKKNVSISKSSCNASQTEKKQFNLFDDFKDKFTSDSEKSKEKKIEQESWEVRTGIFSYLDGRYKYDQNKNDDEWYLKSHEERMKLNENNIKDNKNKHDPLETMKSYLAVMKKNESSNDIKSNSKCTSINLQMDHFNAKKKKKHKKRKKHKRNISSDSSSDSDDEKSRKKLLMENLRAQRLEREKEERKRTMLLLQGNNQIKSEQSEIKQKYNSQFNPMIARQNFIQND